MSLRVAIDVTTAVTQRAGVGRYTRELVRALAALPDGPLLQPFYVAPEVTYALPDVPDQRGMHRDIRRWRLEMAVRQVLRRPTAGPWHGADVYHAPDVVYPPLDGLPVVSTVHDLSFVVYPRYHTRFNATYLRLMTPLVTRRARLVLAVSQATARDLVERLGVPERKVRVVYQSIAAPFRWAPAVGHVAEVRGRYGLPAEFILSVGTQEPRKNLAGILGAYGLLRERLAGAPPLALVGGKGWGLDAQALAGADERHVLRLGHVPDDDLASLYAGCSVFIYPSFYEGWGLPVAEALSLGAPTVTSNLSSLPEVAGDAALLVDPHQPEAIAAAVERILTDAALAARLRSLGPPQAARFTPHRWAAETAQVYAEARDG